MFLFLIPAYLESRQIVMSFKTIPRSSYSQTSCGNSDLNPIFFHRTYSSLHWETNKHIVNNSHQKNSSGLEGRFVTSSSDWIHSLSLLCKSERRGALKQQVGDVSLHLEP